MGEDNSISHALTLARVTPSLRASAACESPMFSRNLLMLSEIKLSLPSDDNFTMRRVIYNYLCVHRFIDNVQKKLYNEDGFYAEKQWGKKNMDELNKQSIAEENTSTQPSDENEQQTQNVAGESTAAPEMQVGKLLCPRCGNAFDQKEKTCPHCGMKNDLKLCKTCGATIAKNAKSCPKCGAKNKKPIYKRVWFWILIALVLIRVFLGLSKFIKTNETGEITEASSAQESSVLLNDEDSDIVGTWSSVILYDFDNMKASYMDATDAEIKFNTDYTGTMSNLTGDVTSFEWHYDSTTDKGERLYKAGNAIVTILNSRSDLNQYAGKLLVGSDSAAVIFERKDAQGSTQKSGSATSKASSENTSMTSSQKNALKKAKSYLEYSAFSHAGLIDQLEYEGYTAADANYAADNCGANWKAQAVKKAKSYLEYDAFSKGELIEQLEYEGFTHEQAVYGANRAY